MEPPFPIDNFDSDDRISFSKLDNKFIAVRNDGSEFEFDAEAKKWVPIDDPVEEEDDDIISFGANHHDHHDHKKRKLEHEHSIESESSKPARPPKMPKATGPKRAAPRQNTAVYVTGLPSDATVAEVFELFSKKGGVIAEEIDSGAPRIKLYTDAEGNFKGDALVVFFKPQSVDMAIMLLDDTDFRIAPNGTRDGRIHVQAADSSYKKVQYDEDNGQGEQRQQQQQQQQERGQQQQGQQQEQPQRQPQRSEKDRQKIIKKTQKLNAKLADWDDDDPYPAQMEKESKWDKVVNLRHMFTLKELEEDPASLLEIKEDVRDECATLGTVTNVILYDLEPEGIIRVKFSDAKAAQNCIKVMHGRHFAGQTVEASLASPRDKFRKSSKEHDGDSD